MKKFIAGLVLISASSVANAGAAGGDGVVDGVMLYLKVSLALPLTYLLVSQT